MPRTHISMGDAGITPRSVTRRDALRLFMGAGVCATFFPAVARAETTQEKLDAAQMSFEDAQAELDRIGQETAEVAGRLSETQVQISELNAQIDQTQADIESKQDEIDERQAQIEEKQKRLGERMTSAYKSGTQGTLDLILSATTFDELTSSIFYLDKVSESEREMIDEVKTLKAELETSKAELEGQKTELEAQRADLEELQAQQQEELAETRAKQQEAQSLVDGLSAEVQELMQQRDEEILAAQRAAEEARRQEEERRRQEEELNQGGGSNWVGDTPTNGSGSLQSVLNAAYAVGSPGTGLCAAWVTDVFQYAGLGSFWGNADDMYYSWCHTATSQIQPGMIIAVNSSPASAAGLIYGHIGIYMGNGIVRHNVGFIQNMSLSSWVSYYSALATPLCGWLGGIVLS